MSSKANRVKPHDIKAGKIFWRVAASLVYKSEALTIFAPDRVLVRTGLRHRTARRNRWDQLIVDKSFSISVALGGQWSEQSRHYSLDQVGVTLPRNDPSSKTALFKTKKAAERYCANLRKYVLTEEERELNSLTPSRRLDIVIGNQRLNRTEAMAAERARAPRDGQTAIIGAGARVPKLVERLKEHARAMHEASKDKPSTGKPDLVGDALNYTIHRSKNRQGSVDSARFVFDPRPTIDFGESMAVAIEKRKKAKAEHLKNGTMQLRDGTIIKAGDNNTDEQLEEVLKDSNHNED
jgi:hypothetical protein